MNDRMIKLFGLKKVANENMQALSLSSAYPELEGMSIDELCSAIAYDIYGHGTTDKTVGDINVFRIESAGYFLGIKNADINNVKENVLKNISELTKRPSDYNDLEKTLEDEEEGLWTKFNKAFDLGKRNRSTSYPAATPAAPAAPAAVPGNHTIINDISEKIRLYENNANKGLIFPGKEMVVNNLNEIVMFLNDEEGVGKRKVIPANTLAASGKSTISSIYGISPSKRPASSSGDSRSRSSDSGSAQGSTTQKIELTLPVGQSVSDNWGTYTATGKLSFSWKRKSDDKAGTYDSTSSGWNTSAEKINKLWDNAPKPATPKSTKPSETTAPSPAASSTERTANPTAVRNIQAILLKASTMRLALQTSQDERGRIRRMAARIGRNYQGDPLNLLAQLIVRKNQLLDSALSAPGDISQQILIAGRNDLIISNEKGKYSQYVNLVLATLNNLFENDYVEQEDAFIESISGMLSKGKAPAAPAQPPAEVLPAKQTSFDPKIKKLAKLRRLRVRAQMEAAVEPSARFGRSRVS